MNRRNWLLTGALVLALLLTLAGPVFSGVAQAQTAEPTSRLRFLNAVPGGPNVDVYLDGALVVPGLAYGEATPHIQVPAGDHQVAVRPEGGDAALVEVSAPLVAELAFTLVVQGASGAVEAALYEDILDELQPGMARLTAINAVADAPGLDVVTTEGGPLLQGVTYNTQFGTVNINTGPQDLVIVPAGGAVESAVASVGETALQSGALYTFVVVGTLEGDTAPSVIVLETPLNTPVDGGARLQVGHGSPDAGPVDVYADEMLLVPSLELGELSTPMPMPTGAYTLSVRAVGSTDSAPVATLDLALNENGTAQTVVVVGEAGAETLALEAFDADLAAVTPEMAHVAIVNAVPGATVSAQLSDEAATQLASDVAASTQSEAVDVTPGEYLLSVTVTGDEEPLDLVVPEMSYLGGEYYTVLVYGGGEAGAPFDAEVVGFPVDVTPASFPGAGEVMAAAPTEEAPAEMTEEPEMAATEEAPVAEATEATPAPEVTEAVPEPAATEETPAAAPTQPTDTELVIEPTPAEGEAAPAAAQPPAATPTPVGAVGYIQLDPGANLHCREYPSATARSLGLIPANATVRVLGRPGEPIVPDTGDPTPEPTPVIETLEDMWLSVQWDQPDGGYFRCWVAAPYVRVEFAGRLLDDLEELLELPEVPFNEPGEAVNTSERPPTPLYNAMLATVNLDPGVSLQIRRDPRTDAEALDRAAAGTQLEVLGYIEAPSEGLTGQPVDPYWVRVRYVKENQAATVGWVSAQYVTFSQLGHTLEITDLPLLEEAEPGFYESPGVQPQIPLEQQDVVGVVSLDPGANLNLRDRPTADARVVVGIPSGSAVILDGRNEDGSWVRVSYESQGVEVQGWVASQYLTITRGGQPYDVVGLPLVAIDSAAQPSGVTPTPTELPAQG